MSKIITALLLALVARNTESLHIQSSSSSSSRRNFLPKAAGIAAAAACGEVKVANAGIDVSGIKVEQPPKPAVTPGRPPNAPKSGPLAGTALGFQVGGGPRSESEVREIDAPRYAAVRKAQGLPPLFLEGVPVEKQPVR